LRKQTTPLVFLLFVLSGCGGDIPAPLDATVTGPEDSFFIVNPPGGGPSLVGPLDFQVANKDSIALREVEIEFFGYHGGVLTDLNGNPLNPTDPTYFKTKTDDRGLARTFFLIGLPACGVEDLTVTGSVGATVGVTSDLWTATYTIKKCS
jgi:hypothetical protein